ncbi:hypothetical protein ACFL2V_16580 [Pseudomonadota bacterium]
MTTQQGNDRPMMKDIKSLKKDLSIQLDQVLPLEQCHNLIAMSKGQSGTGQVESVTTDTFNEYINQVLTPDVVTILEGYFQCEFQVLWPRYDIVDSHAIDYYSTGWHLDGSLKKSLKLFVYLNSVFDHGGNTLIIDQQRTEKLRLACKLPVSLEGREKDLTDSLKQLQLDPSYLAYDLKAGDGLLFNPFQLAHRCLAPREGRARHTLSFTIVPVTEIPKEAGL